MSWLVSSAQHADVDAVRVASPERWRELRRFNAPVQLAVAAAHEVAADARDAAAAALISLAPCRSGSPELHRWVRVFASGGNVRINPTHTMHAVDNLALSVLSIALGDRAWGLSLGGTPGMLWTALELVGERLDEDREVIVLAGDQDASDDVSAALGVALLFSREPVPHRSTGRSIRLLGIDRRRAAAPAAPLRHAAIGAPALLAALLDGPRGMIRYQVPAVHGDGIDDITTRWEIA